MLTSLVNVENSELNVECVKLRPTPSQPLSWHAVMWNTPRELSTKVRVTNYHAI